MNPAFALLIANLGAKILEVGARAAAQAIDEQKAAEDIKAAVAEWEQTTADVGAQIAAGRKLIDAALASLPHRKPAAPPAPAVGGTGPA